MWFTAEREALQGRRARALRLSSVAKRDGAAARKDQQRRRRRARGGELSDAARRFGIVRPGWMRSRLGRGHELRERRLWQRLGLVAARG